MCPRDCFLTRSDLGDSYMHSRCLALEGQVCFSLYFFDMWQHSSVPSPLWVHNHYLTAYCSDGAVRLAVSEDIVQYYLGETDYNTMYYDDADGGLHAGRVELCTNGSYGTVCIDGWDDKEASVVCGQLGYSTCGKL